MSRTPYIAAALNQLGIDPEALFNTIGANDADTPLRQVAMTIYTTSRKMLYAEHDLRVNLTQLAKLTEGQTAILSTGNGRIDTDWLTRYAEKAAAANARIAASIETLTEYKRLYDLLTAQTAQPASN